MVANTAARLRGRAAGLVAGLVAGRITRHLLFLMFFVVGTLLRLAAVLGYRPALWFPDSYTYVVTAMRLRPDLVRPAGYSIFLRALEPFHSFGLVTVVQHLLGLLVGVLVYTTARRCGAPAWAAAPAAAPVLLDAYQIELEHLLVSDTLFALLVTGAVCLALRRPSSALAATGCGLLLAAAIVTRTVGLPLIVVFAFFVLWNGYREARPGRAGWGAPRRLAVLTLAAVVPVAGYMGWFSAANHRFGLVASNGVFLYARTMSFADCGVMKPPPDLAILCDPRPPSDRPAPQEYIWASDSALVRLPGITFTRETDDLAGRFASLAIRSQPLDYITSTISELARSFVVDRPVYPDPDTYGYYEFPAKVPPPPGRHPAVVGTRFAEQYEQGSLTVRIDEPYAGLMRAYQRVEYLPGAVLLGVLLIPPVAGAVRLLRRGRPSGGRDGSRGPEASATRRAAGGPGSPGRWGLPWCTAWALLVIPPATAQFDYRYVLPVAPLACLAAALAVRGDRGVGGEAPSLTWSGRRNIGKAKLRVIP
ncbi:hypothetical protein JOL79_19830 [Microbispora sp. RL4-1S]|uniref:Phospholipid carrier-dependent glycosyltransferase n=1 Tax=Microbispora oryzae TaxID=2806554 RepID=A0A941AJA9_9ACTN|nr:hypothetical protein [Microbispora oryzae]MBP2706061.1 hypothetical protein [Microbispora oryzae]